MISIVIPCRNGATTLARQLDALLAQDAASDMEIVVADNGSTDGTAALVRRYARTDDRVRLVSADGAPGINHARNTGVSASRGTVVLLCDADDVVHPGWLRAHAAAFAAGASCVGGGVDKTLPDGRVLERRRGLNTVHWDIPWPIGANCGFRREVFDRVGGFDESLRGGGDETDFFWRAAAIGHPTTAVPDAVVTYHLRDGLGEVARQFYAYGQGTVRLYHLHGPRGMPGSPWWTSPATVAVGLAQVATSRHRSSRRRQGIERLATRAGRLTASIRLRSWYW